MTQIVPPAVIPLTDFRLQTTERITCRMVQIICKISAQYPA